MTDRIDIFYAVRFMGFVPCYYQPETGELYGVNRLCNFLIDLFAPVSATMYNAFAIHITRKTVTRDYLIKKYNPITPHCDAVKYETSDGDFWRLK